MDFMFALDSWQVRQLDSFLCHQMVLTWSRERNRDSTQMTIWGKIPVSVGSSKDKGEFYTQGKIG